jgi:hypothetical protein
MLTKLKITPELGAKLFTAPKIYFEMWGIIVT